MFNTAVNRKSTVSSHQAYTPMATNKYKCSWCKFKCNDSAVYVAVDREH